VAVFAVIICFLIAGLYSLNHPFLDTPFSVFPKSDKDENFTLENSFINFIFLGIIFYFILLAFKYLKLAQFDQPYLSMRPNGIRLNDIPFSPAGMITWDNIKEIENPSSPFGYSKQFVVIRLKDPTKFRFYSTHSERLITWVLRCITLGFYKGPYLQTRIALQKPKEMSSLELYNFIIEKAEISSEPSTPQEHGQKNPRLAVLIFAGVAVAIFSFSAFSPSFQIFEPRTDYKIQKLTARAESGDAKSQNVLGWRYYRGHGVKKDKEKAFKWWMKSAQQGYTRSESDIGWSYRRGHGVKRNYDKAFEWSMKAALKGYTYAEGSVGWLYGTGNGVEKDYGKSFEWHMKAAEKGHAHSESWVAWLYEKGYGVEQSHTKAIEYYERAAARNYKYAIKRLKRLKAS